MAKVARAARNSSLLRVEEVSASKTIASAESGELYLIQGGDISSAITITLPAVKQAHTLSFFGSLLWTVQMLQLLSNLPMAQTL